MINSHSTAAVPGLIVSDVNFNFSCFVHNHRICFLQVWCPTAFASSGHRVILNVGHPDTLSKKLTVVDKQAFRDIRETASSHSHSGEQRTQKLKSHLVRTQSLNVLPLKPGVGQYVAIHASLTARVSSLLISTFRSIHLHFFKNLSRFFSCVGWG